MDEATLEDRLRDLRDNEPDGQCLVATVEAVPGVVTPVWEPHGEHTEPEHCRAYLARVLN